MKRTQLKDAVRNIIKKIASYLSVIIIAVLGVSSFLGIGYAHTAMDRNASEQYKAMRFRNIEIISPLLLSEDDVEAVRNIDGVADAEPVWMTRVKVQDGQMKEPAVVVTLTERINLPIVLEGRLPETRSECAVEEKLARIMGWNIGDTIDEIESADSTVEYVLIIEDAVITGIVIHPDNASLQVADDPYILFTRDRYDIEEMNGCCMKAVIAVDGASEDGIFSDAHRNTVSAVKERIENLGEDRAGIRLAEIKADAYKEMDGQEDDILGYLGMIEEKESELREKRSGLETRDKTLENAEKALGELEPGSDEYSDAEAKIRTDRVELAGEFEQLEKEENETAGYRVMIEQALAGMGGERKKIDEMEPESWLVLDESGNASFVQIRSSSQNIASLQMTFALLFIVISALVIYATVGKMVDEQRKLVGTTKALGFYKREIFAKYLLFGVSAVLIGTLIGVLLARFMMESIALDGYNDYLAIDITRPAFDTVSTVIVAVAGAVLASAAVWFACRKLLRSSANELMQAPVPPAANRGTGKAGHRLSLASRLSLKNIRADFRRVAVTAVSIAGCCALIVIGFTLKHAVSGCAGKQYSKIIDYDMGIGITASAEEEISEILDEAGAEYTVLYEANVSTFTDSTGSVRLLCGDLESISGLYHLLDWRTGKPVVPDGNGVLICRRFAETNSLEVGDELEMTVNLTDTASVRVAGVFENYIGLPAVMSREYYESVFGKEALPNMIFVRLNGMDEEDLKKETEKIGGVESFIPADKDKSVFEASTGVIDSVVSLFIGMAAIMAGVVLLNLTNIQFLQKKREMTVMRINGFSTGDVIRYVGRENVVTTSAGIVLGIVLGALMAYSIVQSLEQSFVQFDRNVSLLAWLLAAAVTFLFSAAVNFIVLRKVRKLNLTDMN